jgi:signal transduction histidine kinase
MPRRDARDALTIKAALLIGFGLTLGLWLFSGYWLAARMTRARDDAATINQRYRRAQELLSTVRAQVLLGSVYVRDALLDPGPTTVDEYRRQLEATYGTIDEALSAYVPIIGTTDERDRIQQLRGEIEQLRATMREVLAEDTSLRPVEARVLLQRRIVPKRETVIRVSEEAQSLNREAFLTQQTAIASVYAETQQQMWLQLGLALIASAAIGLFATRYVSRLEDRLRQGRARDAENTRDLQRLSAKLITAQEDERRTIARELHDEVGQVLMAVKVELGLAQRALDAEGGRSPVLENARGLTDNALHTVRDLSRLLHPGVLDDLGLPAAVDSHLREFSRRHGVRAELLHEGMDERLPREIETTAYRAVQEALTNVVKHSQATSCRVYLQRLLQTVLVTIEDDGVGFDAEALEATTSRAGLGLLGVRERVTRLRGTVRLESRVGKGTRLTLELPVSGTAPALDAGDADQPRVGGVPVTT